jgi:hypothetical protein
LAKLATETDDNDDAIGDILKANDQCERIVNQYKSIFENDSSLLKIPDNDVNLVNLSSATFSHEDIISNNNNNDSIRQSTYDPLRDLEELFSKPTQSQTNDLINKLYEKNNNDQNSFDFKISNATSVIPPMVLHSVNHTQNIKQNKNVSETSRFFFFYKCFNLFTY